MIGILSFTTCVLTMLGSWFVSQGRLRPAYLVGIVNGSCFVVVDLILAIEGPHPAVAILAVPSAWGIAMGFVGLKRLQRERSTQPFSNGGV